MKPNDQFTLKIQIKDAVDVFGLSAYIQFDPEIVVPIKNDDLIQIEDGGFLSQDNQQITILAKMLQGSDDTIVLGCSRMGQTNGVSGQGALCLIRFTVLPINISDGEILTNIVLIKEKTKLKNSSNQNMPYTSIDAEVKIEKEIMATIELIVGQK